MAETSPLTTAQEKFAAAVPFRITGSESISLTEALGRVLYQDIASPIDLPPYHRAIVEGYIVHSEDTTQACEQKPAHFSIVGTVKPGDGRFPSIQHGEAVEVMTGSMVPDGAYAVVRMWEAKRTEDTFTITRPFPARFFIEDQGCDIKRNTTVINAGTLLNPEQIGLLASMGITQLTVARKPFVTIFACGNEVVPYEQTLRPGSIRDSNSIMLSTAVTVAGGTSYLAGILRDDFDTFVHAMRNALQTADMILISGGTAAGGRDFISDLVHTVGKLLIDGVPMRSGRPLIMGMAENKPIVCVAGHPPEALRGFNLFGAVALHRLMGQNATLPEDRPPA